MPPRAGWAGAGATALKLSGGVGEGDLGRLLEAVNPADQKPLPRPRAGRPPSNAAFDLTFAAPKSLSVLAAVGGERVRQAVLWAQEAGVRDALAYLEDTACFVRRGKGGTKVLPGAGFAAGLFTHEMSRSADPHLHTHLVVANRVKGPDGNWTAPDMRPVYGASKVAGAVCDARVRAELTRSLGVEWERGASAAWEVRGIPHQVLEHFSARHAEILEEARARGWTSAAGLAVLQRETRDHKPEIDREVAQARWQARAAEHGLGRDEIAALFAHDRHPARQEALDADLAELATTLAGRTGLTARGSTYTRREVVTAFADAHPDGASRMRLEDLADRFLDAHGVPVTEARGHLAATWTAAELLVTEARLLERVEAADVAGAPLLASEIVEQALVRHVHLGSDQVAAVRQLAATTGLVAVLEARAGTGKTTTLRALAEACHHAGVPILGTRLAGGRPPRCWHARAASRSTPPPASWGGWNAASSRSRSGRWSSSTRPA